MPSRALLKIGRTLFGGFLKWSKSYWRDIQSLDIESGPSYSTVSKGLLSLRPLKRLDLALLLLVKVKAFTPQFDLGTSVLGVSLPY